MSANHTVTAEGAKPREAETWAVPSAVVDELDLRDSVVYPAGPTQEGLLFVDELLPGTPAYCIPMAARLHGPLDVGALEQSIQAVVDSHEALRATFRLTPTGSFQIVHRSRNVTLSVVDAGAMTEEETTRALEAFVRSPFDLGGGPLIRATVVRLGEEEHLLALAVHHIVSDGHSLQLICRDLARSYNALVTDDPPEPDALRFGARTGYAAALALTHEKTTRARESSLAHWRLQLDGAPEAISLASRRQRPQLATFDGRLHVEELSAELSHQLRKRAGELRCTVFMLVFALFATLLHELSGDDDIVVGSPISTRDSSFADDVVGLFVHTLPLRMRIDPKATLAEHAAQARSAILGALAHRDVPLEAIVREVHPARTLAYAPLFQIAFAADFDPTRALDLDGVLAEQLVIHTGTCHFDMIATLEDCGSKFRLRLEYNTMMFDGAEVEAVGARLRALIERAAGGWSGSLADVPRADRVRLT